MSRLVMLLEERAAPGAAPLTVASLDALLQDLVARLDAPAGRIELAFPYFVRKTAPVSGVASMLDYEVRLTGELRDGRITKTIAVAVPVTSLCPCSKEIADYGAHNQRSTVTIAVRTRADVELDELLRVAEEEASSELYGILKRADEKYVTERAYDNPRFVEDLVRGVAGRLAADARFAAWRRGRELRVDPQPLGVRAHRAGHVGALRLVAAGPSTGRAHPVAARPTLKPVRAHRRRRPHCPRHRGLGTRHFARRCLHSSSPATTRSRSASCPRCRRSSAATCARSTPGSTGAAAGAG